MMLNALLYFCDYVFFRSNSVFVWNTVISPVVTHVDGSRRDENFTFVCLYVFTHDM